MTNVIVVGAGAQAKYALETFRFDNAISVVGVLDTHNNADIWGSKLHYATILGPTTLLKDKLAEAAIICVADPVRKQALMLEAEALGYSIVSAIHPTAVIADTATLAPGVIINALAVLQPQCKIGLGVMIHAGVIVEHDCQIGAFANLAPGVRLAGWVNVGARARLYTGACVIPKISIADDCVVAAGAVVIENVTLGDTVGGVPAKPLH